MFWSKDCESLSIPCSPSETGELLFLFESPCLHLSVMSGKGIVPALAILQPDRLSFMNSTGMYESSMVPGFVLNAGNTKETGARQSCQKAGDRSSRSHSAWTGLSSTGNGGLQSPRDVEWNGHDGCFRGWDLTWISVPLFIAVVSLVCFASMHIIPF